MEPSTLHQPDVQASLRVLDKQIAVRLTNSIDVRKAGSSTAGSSGPNGKTFITGVPRTASRNPIAWRASP